MADPRSVLPADVQNALQRGQFIEAVKMLRNSTGAGIKEAREVIDVHVRQGALNAAPGASGVGAGKASQAAPAARQKAAPPALRSTGATPPAVLEAIRNGNNFEAVRLMREQGGLGLKEAKHAVDVLVEQHEIAHGTRSPGEVPRSGTRLWMVVIVAGLIYLLWRLFARAE